MHFVGSSVGLKSSYFFLLTFHSFTCANAVVYGRGYAEDLAGKLIH